MKHRIRELILNAAGAAHATGALPSPDFPEVSIEEPKLGAHGDYSTNLAMVTAAAQKMPPHKIAAAILAHLQDPQGLLERTEIAGPGFINFFIRPGAWLPFLYAIHERDERYGACDIGQGASIQVEFVSANPTGPLHVGHGRGAAVGDTVANILAFCGYRVAKEYYINDSGRQIQTLGRSVFLRYKALFETGEPFPDDCYQGTYIIDLARQLKDHHGRRLLERDPGEAVADCARWAADFILAGIREDLTS
ncbi:MAG: arginine--tRNA ligase, partial [Desulfobacterales bacterium]|nr:arginine--tRNA ligase [Desulfobacterales bacterium]